MEKLADDSTTETVVDTVPFNTAEATGLVERHREGRPSSLVLDEDTQREALMRLKRTRAGHAADVTRKHSDLKCSLNQSTIEEACLKLDRLKEAFKSFDMAHSRYMELALTFEPDRAQNHQEHRNLLEKSVRDATLDVQTHQPLQNKGMSYGELGNSHDRSLKGSDHRTQLSCGSTSSAMAKAASRKAALLAKAQFLEQQQAMEKEMHLRKLALDRLKLEAEIKAAAAEEETLAKYVEVPDRIALEEMVDPVAKQEFNPQANEFVQGAKHYIPEVQQQHQSTGGQQSYIEQGAAGQQLRSRDDPPPPPDVNPFKDLADAIRDITSSGRLPAPEPAVFSGDPLRYGDWEASFEALIHQNSVRPEERMHYLRKYLAGPAKEAVEGYFLMTSPQAYNEARGLLKKRFGKPLVIANAFKKKLEKWPKIAPRDHIGLRKFADFLHQCKAAMSLYGNLGVLDSEMENASIITKLPERLLYCWNRISFDYQEQHGRFPPFQEFSHFITQESEIACNPLLTQILVDQRPDRTKGPSKGQGSRTLATKQCEPLKKARPIKTSKKQDGKEKSSSKVEDSKEFKFQPKPCICCKEVHYLDECPTFAEKSTKEKNMFIEDNNLCYACLKQGHFSTDCKRRAFCKICSKRHPTPLHRDQLPESTPEDPVSATSKDTVVNHVGRSGMQSQLAKSTMILPVYLSHKDQPEKEILVYALIDSQSDTSFLSRATFEDLEVPGTRTSLLLSTMTTFNARVDSTKVYGLQVRGVNSNIHLPLLAAYTREAIPVNRTHIPTPEMTQGWPHLSHIATQLMPLQNVDVGILIGYDCPQAMIPREVVTSPGHGPFAQRTDLGWSIIGMVDPSQVQEDTDEIGRSCQIVACDVKDSHCHKTQIHFVHRTTVKESFLPTDVLQRLEGDFHEGDGEAMSYEDKLFLEKLAGGIHRRKDGHYEMPLPLKPNMQLPNNRLLALKRLQHLKKRLQRDEQLNTDYKTFMFNMLAKGYAEKVPLEEIDTKEGNVWYIPHHGVYNQKKPGKIRVVFDASAQYRGDSLNNHLLKGPDLANTLVGILCRFRQEQIAITVDVEQMFFQFGVNREHRDLLRFLWWEEGNEEPIDFRMTVHLFGATSSPGCANFGLKQCAKDYEDKYGTEAADFIHDNFYVDDGLKSLPSVQQAVDLLSDVKAMCSAAGIHLHKCTSNSKQVLMAVPKEDQATSLQNVNLLKDMIPVEGALGISWCLESDKFQFRIVLQDKPLTRRGILSTVSSIYDPLGFVAPVVLIGKRILQDMCKQNAGWDEPLPEQLRSRWEKWRGDLVELENIDIPRCYKPADFKECVKMELHHFADASYEGYGQCTYLRQIDEE